MVGVEALCTGVLCEILGIRRVFFVRGKDLIFRVLLFVITHLAWLAIRDGGESVNHNGSAFFPFQIANSFDMLSHYPRC